MASDPKSAGARNSLPAVLWTERGVTVLLRLVRARSGLVSRSNVMKSKRIACAYWVVFCLIGWVFSLAHADTPLQTAMDQVVSRLYARFTPEQLLQIDQPAIDQCITPEERQVFATKFWCFDVNVPVIVSVMRDVKQAIVPFWLAERSFTKTKLRVRNEEYEYEVWQKPFDAGRVELGVPGFEKHRPNYFVSVGAQQPGVKPELTRFFPPDQQFLEFREGAFTYHDWSDLLLTEVPPELKGQILLPTIRGRARESHLVQAFRKTPFPSSDKPDQAVLTWSEDPRTTQTIQWRLAPTENSSVVRYKEKNAADWTEVKAQVQTLEDRMLVNDQRVNHFTAVLSGLKPATKYAYSIDGIASSDAEFTTAPSGDSPFTFFFLSDTHNSPATTELLDAALAQYPKTAFCTISGDLVGTGQYRDNWDSLFHYGAAFFATHPLMPAMGNHDSIDGLGADLYRGLLELPANGPEKLETERAYTFQYGNTLFLIADVTATIEDQTPWIEEQLSRSTATWKFAVFHFPPYAPNDENPDIVREWVPLFDKHHVDFVLTGHIHNYLRTYPLKGGKRVESPADGTVYFITVSVKDNGGKVPRPDYAAAVDDSGAPLVTVFTIQDGQAATRTIDNHGSAIDEATYHK